MKSPPLLPPTAHRDTLGDPAPAAAPPCLPSPQTGAASPRHPGAEASGCRAFTLVELLAVIAIVGILAALTLASVSIVRSHIRSAKCLSNLRQYVVATHLFAADHRGILPQTQWVNNASQETFIHLASYIGSAKEDRQLAQSIMDCPEKDVTTFAYKNISFGTYVGNDQMTGNLTWHYGFNSMMDRLPANIFTQANRQVWIMDMAAGGRWVTMQVLRKQTHPQQLRSAFPRPHRGKLAFGFLDGHAELRRLSTLTYDMFIRDVPPSGRLVYGKHVPMYWEGLLILTPEQEEADEVQAINALRTP